MELLNKDAVDYSRLRDWEIEALKLFDRKMTDKAHRFPCIPATQGYQLNHLRYGFASEPRTMHAAADLAALLKAFTLYSHQFGNYTSLIVFFETPPTLHANSTIEDFEQLFWKLLQNVSELDEKEWPEAIPINPSDPLWEFCFHGERYFMYGASPAHIKRKSRHFPYFMLAITPRWVLNAFNSHPEHAVKIKKQIRKRLNTYDAIPPHPALNQYGDESNLEWMQYFLRDDERNLTKCPFHQAFQKPEQKK
ncbi:hypothetical protein GCM10011391_22910 [Pullulanibacillus camelliae]|uniref:YqcI/YcgG family protein n=1 Tax=Pullulanibacillus camelliae TaxID=1707096 RepID=A0A8J2YHQ9_9BACL|nr:YqcI/YcgG family protein [Pullulanibacillus camelliae]GGE43573.1 hypothetical protein GCM10011391_22910 [Pullulanibacillus camelliae]